MFTTRKPIMGLFVDKGCPEHWIVRDHEGRFWAIPPGEADLLSGLYAELSVFRAAVDEAHEVLGGLTRVANIVGLVSMKPFLEMDSELWAAQLQLNLYSQMHVCRAAGRHMVADGGGSIAMVASVSGIYGARNQAAYGASKAALIRLTDPAMVQVEQVKNMRIAAYGGPTERHFAKNVEGK